MFGIGGTELLFYKTRRPPLRALESEPQVDACFNVSVNVG